MGGCLEEGPAGSGCEGGPCVKVWGLNGLFLNAAFLRAGEAAPIKDADRLSLVLPDNTRLLPASSLPAPLPTEPVLPVYQYLETPKSHLPTRFIQDYELSSQSLSTFALLAWGDSP